MPENKGSGEKQDLPKNNFPRWGVFRNNISGEGKPPGGFCGGFREGSYTAPMREKIGFGVYLKNGGCAFGAPRRGEGGEETPKDRGTPKAKLGKPKPRIRRA